MIEELKILLDNIIEKNCVYFEYDFVYQENAQELLPVGWSIEYYYNTMYFIHQFLYKNYKDFIKNNDDDFYSEKWFIRYKDKSFVAEYFCGYGGEDFYISLNRNDNVEDNEIKIN